MFLIQNVSKVDIVLSDLHVSLVPHQSLDLDKVCPRQRADSSPGLALSLQKKLLKVLHKDVPVSQEERVVRHVYEKDDLKALQSKIKDIEKKSSPSNNGEISALNKKLDILIETIKNQKTVVLEKPETKEEDVKTEVDEQTLANIHARAVTKMTQNVQSNINSKEEIKKNDLNKNIDELSNLL